MDTFQCDVHDYLFISVFVDSLEFAVYVSWVRIIDVIAVCSFTSELFLRVCTTHQVDEHQELGMSLCVVPNIIAKLNRRLIGNILRRTVPVMIRQPLFIIDLVIVVVGFIGLIFTFQGKSLPRAFILLRICKLGRLLDVVLRDRQLYVLLTGKGHVFSTAVWSTVILWCFNYTIATFMVQMFGQHSSHAGDDSLQNCWNNTQRSIRTLFQLSTFSEWIECVDSVADAPAAWILLVASAVFTGLGVVSTVTAITVEVAFNRFKHMDQRRLLNRIHKLRFVLRDMKKRLMSVIQQRRECDKNDSVQKDRLQIPFEHLLRLWSTPRTSLSRNMPQPSWPWWLLRSTSRVSSLVSRGEEDFGLNFPTEEADESEAGESFLTVEELEFLLSGPVSSRLLKLGVRGDQVMVAFQKLDIHHRGRVKVDELLGVIARIIQPLQGIDVAATKSILRRSLLDSQQLGIDTDRCQEYFFEITEKLRGVQLCLPVEETVEAAWLKASLRDTVSKEKLAILRRKNKALSRRVMLMQRKVRHVHSYTANICPFGKAARANKGLVDDDCSTIGSADRGYE